MTPERMKLILCILTLITLTSCRVVEAINPLDKELAIQKYFMGQTNKNVYLSRKEFLYLIQVMQANGYETYLQ